MISALFFSDETGWPIKGRAKRNVKKTKGIGDFHAAPCYLEEWNSTFCNYCSHISVLKQAVS